MWAVTVVFILQTWRKMRGVQDKVDQLEKAVANHPGTGG
jgi:hypothetical protein